MEVFDEPVKLFAADIRPQHISVGKAAWPPHRSEQDAVSEVNPHARSNNDEVVLVISTGVLEMDVSQEGQVYFTTRPKLVQSLDKESANASAPPSAKF